MQTIHRVYWAFWVHALFSTTPCIQTVFHYLHKLGPGLSHPLCFTSLHTLNTIGNIGLNSRVLLYFLVFVQSFFLPKNLYFFSSCFYLYIKMPGICYLSLPPRPPPYSHHSCVSGLIFMVDGLLRNPRDSKGVGEVWQ